MMLGTHVRTFLVMVSVSAAAHAGNAVEIPRTVDGTLSSGATAKDVGAMLVGARWVYLNPDKEHSTWESKTLVFDATGSVDITTGYAWGPRTIKSPWRVTRAGTAPVVDIGGVAYSVAPCRFSARTTCLVGPHP